MRALYQFNGEVIVQREIIPCSLSNDGQWAIAEVNFTFTRDNGDFDVRFEIPVEFNFDAKAAAIRECNYQVKNFALWADDIRVVEQSACTIQGNFAVGFVNYITVRNNGGEFNRNNFGR